MADNVNITPGSGSTVRTDDVGGVQYQVVKLDLGGDGASIPVVTTLPVSGTVGVSGTVTISGSVTVSNFPATQPVSGTVTANAGTGPWPVTDNAGSLTVDAPVGTPVFVRLSDGAAPIATLPVSGTFWQATQPVSGTVAVSSEPNVGTDAATTEPSVGLVGGWDGAALRAMGVLRESGRNTVMTSDLENRLLLQEILLQLVAMNQNLLILASATGMAPSDALASAAPTLRSV